MAITATRPVQAISVASKANMVSNTVVEPASPSTPAEVKSKQVKMTPRLSRTPVLITAAAGDNSCDIDDIANSAGTVEQDASLLSTSVSDANKDTNKAKIEKLKELKNARDEGKHMADRAAVIARVLKETE